MTDLQMNTMGLSSIKYEQEEDDDAAQETSTSGDDDKDQDIDMTELDDGMEADVTVPNVLDLDQALGTSNLPNNFGGITDFGAIADLRESHKQS